MLTINIIFSRAHSLYYVATTIKQQTPIHTFSHWPLLSPHYYTGKGYKQRYAILFRNYISAQRKTTKPKPKTHWNKCSSIIHSTVYGNILREFILATPTRHNLVIYGKVSNNLAPSSWIKIYIPHLQPTPYSVSVICWS